jgi:hypothetical protein
VAGGKRVGHMAKLKLKLSNRGVDELDLLLTVSRQI